MSSARRTFYRRVKGSIRHRRGVAHQVLRHRAPAVSRALVRGADAARSAWFRRSMPATNRPVEQILRAYAADLADFDRFLAEAKDTELSDRVLKVKKEIAKAAASA